MQRLAVVGAGVIGLSCAWRAALVGWTVTLIDPRPARGASWVAGGMLAPVTEAWPGEEELLDFGLDSLRRWPRFAAELAAAAGRPPGLRRAGTVVAATGAGDRAELGSLAEFLGRLGREVDQLTGRELRRLEPALGPDVRGGLSVPGDLAVDNRAFLAALQAACDRVGVETIPRAVAVFEDGGVRLAGDPDVVAADAVLLCAGAHSGLLHPALATLVRPVKGEILRLAHRGTALPPPTRTVRALVDGRPLYAVPRDDGGLVIGATQYEAGFDTDVTVAGVRDLLRDAERVLPAVAEFTLVETAAGLRPGSPDNRPLIGPLGNGLFVATGHGRNGMLLAPVTADAVVAVLDGGRGPSAADPARFAAQPAGR
ncbi:MAG: glycine oxidase ThiO [Pseudonocardia sp.]|nr:glycine oxidase ThiO [Pseudonocardia sp.]